MDTSGRQLADFSDLPAQNGDPGAAGAPAVTSVEVVSDAGEDRTYALGDRIRIGVTFSAAVDVTGTPRLRIDMDPADRGEKWAGYQSGGGTATLTFAYDVVAPNVSRRGIAVLADTLQLDGGTIRKAGADADAALAHDGLGHDPKHKVDGRRPLITEAEVDGTALTITFNEQLAAAKEAPEKTVLRFRFIVKGTSVEQSPVRVAVDGSTVTLGLGTAAEAGQQITVSYDPGGSGERLRDAAGNEAAAFADEPVKNATLPPLTAGFVGVPAEHGGQGVEFSFELRFSEDFPGRLPYKKLKEEALQATNGRVVGAARMAPNQNQSWTIRVRPWSSEDVTVSMSATTDCDAAGGICTPDGRPLSNATRATVIGPVGISVADARVEEDKGAVLAFAVTLSRAATSAFTVDYATSDGSAKAGVDYTAKSGTLSFQAGDSSGTIEVAVLDDSHDEGEETLTLTLSNASSGLLIDGEATGTIENRDPLPRALLARFGRTAAVHVVEHVEERLQAPREPGIQGRFAGREVRRGMERDFALSFLNQLGASAGVSPLDASAGVSPLGGSGHGPMVGSPGGGAGGMGPLGTVGSAAGAPMGTAAPPGGMAAPTGAAGFGAPGPGGPETSMGAASGPADGMMHGGGLLQMGLGGGDLLTGSSFSMNRESRGGILSFWSRGARSHFTGQEGTLGLNGDVRTTMFGADWARGPILAGLSLSHSRGLGEYSGVTAGQVLSSVTGLYPWLGYKATDRITVWGVGGYGVGGLLLTPQGGAALESALSMMMAAAGTRGELLAGGASGFALAFKTDALWVGTSIDGVDGPAGRLKATDAAVTRLRTGLEGSRAYTLAGRLSLTPSVEVGLRQDGGDAETGAGMDVGAGLVVSDSSSGLSVDVRVRTLLVHQDEGFRERGVALSLSYSPTPSTPLGFTAKVAPSWGGQASGGAAALWGRETMGAMAHGSLAQGNAVDAELGYGLPVGSRLVGTPRVGLRTSEHGRDYRFGYGLGALETSTLRVELSVDAQRRENPQTEASNGFLGQATVGW